jgi:hypothetical protein
VCARLVLQAIALGMFAHSPCGFMCTVLRLRLVKMLHLARLVGGVGPVAEKVADESIRLLALHQPAAVEA